MRTELQALQEELRVNHLKRIRDTQPGIQYFKLMKRGNEILKRIKELEPAPPPENLPPSTLWSEKEVQLLRENYGKLSHAEIATLLEDRTELAVRSKAHALGLANELKNQEL